MVTEVTTLDSMLADLEAKAKRVPEGPWFAASDDAHDAPPHKESGLALVDTGRESDWPIGRLMEWSVARYFEALAPDKLEALISAIKSDRERVRREALEEATMKAEHHGISWIAVHIRALKDKEPT